MAEERTGTEIIAREIAFWHGSRITGPTRTIASDRGYGSWGNSPEKYANNHWREYINAAERMLERINRLTSEDEELERLRRLEQMARHVLETFQKDEAQGYRSRDRQYAIELLAKGFELSGTLAQDAP